MGITEETEGQHDYLVLVPGKTKRVLGYHGFAELATTLRRQRDEDLLTAKAIRNYWAKDQARGQAHLLPQPVVFGERNLPYWLPSQVVYWDGHRLSSRDDTVV
jgi:hypothetical protein